jgi:hypothetical protein
MPKIIAGFSAASLLAISTLVAMTSASAEPLAALTPPVITLTKAGGAITETPATWNSAVKSTISWIVNGKATAGKSGKSFTPPSTKGTRIQALESANGVTATSNTIIIGNVAVNGFITISYTDPAKSQMSVVLPKTTPANATPVLQWFSGPFEVKGAHATTYQLATGDQGNDISLQVSYSAKGFGPTSATSQSISIPVIPRSYSLIWSEDFNSGSSINASVWSPENGDGAAFKNRGWGNLERQWYLDSQSAIDSTGVLVTTATTTGANAYSCYYGTPCEWLSSKFVTKNKVGFKYGRIEARIKGPVGAGTWGAFWMLGANIDDRPWPGCGEIDVTELLGRTPTTVYGTPHGPASGQSFTTSIDAGIASDYHTYAVDWLPDQITWYLDGKPYGTLNKASLTDPAHTWVFDHEYYLLINLAMGGTFGGAIDPDLKSATMSVDWVHVSSINGVGEVIKH